MLPEAWQGVKRLMLACSIDDETSLVTLSLTVRSFQPVLTVFDSYLLLLHRQHYKFFALTSQFEVPKLDNFFQRSQPYSHTELIESIRTFAIDAAIIFTAPLQSPFSLAYLCYLAGIPIRLGQSQEFGGGVLSHCITPPLEPMSTVEYHLHLLRSAGFKLHLNELTSASI